jgi:hypothetical protein
MTMAISPVPVLSHLCPECASDYRERVHSEGMMEQIARLLGWNVYRCLECGHHFYDRPIRRAA